MPWTRGRKASAQTAVGKLPSAISRVRKEVDVARFDGKTALVPGAGSGIGRAIAEVSLEAWDKVIGANLSDDASFITGSYQLIDGGYTTVLTG